MAKLGDFMRIKHGFAFKGDYITAEDNEIVLVTPGNFEIGGGFKEKKCKFFSGDYPKDYVLHADDLIVTMTDLSKQGDTLGYSARVPNSNRIYLHNQRIGLVDVFNPNADKDYLYWFMRTPQYQKKIVATASGSTVKHTSPSRICDVEINLPSIDKQKKIASLLNSIEKKIHISERINANFPKKTNNPNPSPIGNKFGLFLLGPSGESRTHGLLNPIQARYQNCATPGNVPYLVIKAWRQEILYSEPGCLSTTFLQFFILFWPAHFRPQKERDQALSRSSKGRRYCPVKLPGTAATCSGVPVATISPPALPPSGPRSMI